MDTNTKILVISSSTYNGRSQVNDGKYEAFSTRYEHYLAARTNNKKCRKLEKRGYVILGFYQPIFMTRMPFLSRFVFILSALMYFGIVKRRSLKLDLIVARDPLRSGALGFILSRMLSIPLLVELNGNFASSVLWERPNRRIAKIKRYVGTRLARFVLAKATAVKQLYPTQLSQLAGDCKPALTYSFHEYVSPQGLQKAEARKKNYLITMGSPWNIKGFDITVDAYRKVLGRNANYPFDLFIVGYIRPNEFAEFTKACDLDHPRIHLLKPVSYEKAQMLLSEAVAMVLASRTEAMGRVLIESMRLGTLCVASRVDGIPFYVEDNKTGLLFDTENTKQLADLLERISLHNFGEMTDLAQRTAIHRFGTAEFVRQYQEMIDATIDHQTKLGIPV